jgi:hypothetical protein
MLAAVPDKFEFPSGSPPWRRGYFLAASAALAARVGDTDTVRAFGKRTDDSMPKSPQDKAPAAVVDGFFLEDTRNACDSDNVPKLQTWGDALNRATNVSGAV